MNQLIGEESFKGISSMKFYAPRTINLYSTNKITEWVHAQTKITEM